MRRVVVHGLAVACLGALGAVGWWLLAPPQLGGSTSYVVIHGSSMEPGLERNDLAIVRARDTYAPGDAVLYFNEGLGEEVLHRIVRVEGGRFVLKGDANDFVDEERPAPDHVHGTLLFSVPAVGGLLHLLHEPLNAALVLFAAVFLALTGGHGVSRRRARRMVAAPPHRPQAEGGSRRAVALAGGSVTAGLVGAALFGLLAALAWTRPASHAVQGGIAYAHTGIFSYSSPTGRSAVYPDGAADTGETVFLRLARFVDVGFAYRLETRERSRVRGSTSLDALVSDGSGWSRTLPLARGGPFEGQTAAVSGRLDLRRVEALVARMRRLTGSTASTFEVEVMPRISVLGYAGRDVVDAAFAPSLRFVLDSVELRLDAAAGETPLLPREEVTSTAAHAATLGAGPLTVGVSEARTISSVGVLVSLLVAAGAALLAGRRLAGDEAERIEARHGGRIVDVVTPVPESRWVTDVADFDSLLRVADLYERVILHSADDGRHVYVVDDGVAVYRYRTGGPLPSARLAPAGP